MAELLLAVRVVCADQRHVAALLHGALSIDAFLWAGIKRWTLERASQRGFMSLLDRLLKHERSSYTRKFRELRLCRAVDDAFQLGYDIHVLVWWLNSYMPDQQVYSLTALFELAIERTKLLILEWLYQETKGVLPDLQEPVSCYDPDTVIWLHEHSVPHACARLSLNGP